MRRLLTVLWGTCLLGACNIWSSTDVPEGFGGWFHVDRSGRATSLTFATPDTTHIHDLACDRSLLGSTTWVADGTDTLVLTQWTGAPRFTKDPTVAGALVATPGMYSSAPEQWLPGATCLACPVGDAGVAVACDGPAVLDGGT
jgi:hypothetical protein